MKQTMNGNRICLLGAALLSTAGAAALAGYEHDYQKLHGQRATFNVAGPATGDTPDVEADAMLTSVVYPNGEEYVFFYKPTEVTNITHNNTNFSKWGVRAGTKTSGDLSGFYTFGEQDGDGSSVSAQDLEDFAGLMLQAFQTNNLNQYVDLGGGGGATGGDQFRFEFMIKFDMTVKDNDAGSDEFGELLYLERGSGYGNSWLKIQACDENGTALGPWLVIDPAETVQTTPETTVYRSSQKIGTTSIDISRLGVSEFEYLKVSNDCPGEYAYTGGGDLNPDFKIMAVITNEDQLAKMMLFD